jgi:hypothetical protein
MRHSPVLFRDPMPVFPANECERSEILGSRDSWPAFWKRDNRQQSLGYPSLLLRRRHCERAQRIRGDKVCGLLLDEVNQDDFTDEGIERWVAQLKDEGILQE